MFSNNSPQLVIQNEVFTSFYVMITRLFLTVLLLLSHALAGTASFPTGKTSTTVPFTEDRGHIIIPIRVNGSEPVQAILDTGAQGAVLYDNALAEKFGLTGAEEVEIHGAGGAGAGMQAKVAKDVQFQIGDATISGNQVVIANRAIRGRDVQFVVGQSIFRSAIVFIDWDKHELTLSDPEKFKYSGKGHELGLEFDQGGRPYIHATVSTADAKNVPVKLVLDTGAMHALSIEYGTSPQLKEPTGEKVVFGRGASGEVKGYLGVVPSFTIAGQTFTDIPTTFPDESFGPARGSFGRNGNVGSGILNRFNITYDYPHSRLYLEPNSHVGDPFRQFRPRPAPQPALK